MADFSRRQFLKTLGLAGTATLAGCSEPVRQLIPYVIPPEDIVPGEATWYASTCRECPAGCGLLVKNRDGHIVKVEGNPLHPVNVGRLCARGQASVQGLYNPDRYKGPMMRDPSGKSQPVTWEVAEKTFVRDLSAARRKGTIVFVTGLVTGAEEDLIGRWVATLGGEHIIYEPFAYESLRRANRIVFGEERIPNYRIDLADFLISFGANFLETWMSNVQYARQFGTFHEAKKTGKNVFVYVGPRLSMTAANADHWVSIPPGCESLVALGLLRLLLQQSAAPFIPGLDAIASTISTLTPQAVEEKTGVKASILSTIARQFLRARRPLVLAEGTACQDRSALDTAVAANYLCMFSAGSRQLLDFSNPSSIGRVGPASQMRALTERMSSGEVSALIIHQANPAFSLPAAWEFEKALRKVPWVVSFSSYPDETTEPAGLIMPTHTFLESWGDYSPQKNVTGLLQPAMGPVFDTRSLGDMLLYTGRMVGGKETFPEKDFYEVVRNKWSRKTPTPSEPASFEAFWQESLRRGGVWGPDEGRGSSQKGRKKSEEGRPSETDGLRSGRAGSFAFSAAPARAPEKASDTFDFFSYPTIQFFDGRTANRPFLQEMPDPMTMIMWDGWVEINPEEATRLGIEKGDLLSVRAGDRTVQAPAFPYVGIPAGSLAMPIGHGRARISGRYVSGETGNPARLLSGQLDPAGGFTWSASPVIIEKTGRSVPLANADGSGYQHGRKLAQSLTFEQYRSTSEKGPEITMPLPSGFDEKHDFYPSHKHVDYRWCMVVDLDRCIGCQACVVACYAENNVGIVGKRDALKGREMSWLHIERYFEPDQPFIRFLPMLCQHCDEAPCESVCPVFAPHHSNEGINNQVYNRCVGTRFCNQNCPYKVRRFNWFTFSHDEPLGWQLNPDVTVRQKGVMEKCSFCIQRIVQAKADATTKGRKIIDGEFTTACAQTCPTEVFTFGNLMDPESRVSKLLRQARAYQVLRQLNTKPAVIYLKKITVERLDG